MRLVHVCAAAVLVVTASPAAAAITIVNLAGVVTSGTDNGHALGASPFGLPQSSSANSTGTTTGSAKGQQFTLAIQIDESLGDTDVFPNGQQRSGAGLQSPVQAVFTMNGRSHAFGNLSSTVIKTDGAVDQFFFDTLEQRQRPSMTGDFTNVNGFLNGTLNLPPTVFKLSAFSEPARWSRFARGRATATGALTLSLQDTSGTPLSYIVGPFRTASLTLRFDSFSIAGVGQTPPPPPPLSDPVPEPSTWALLIGGFGAAGAALRRRRWIANAAG